MILKDLLKHIKIALFPRKLKITLRFLAIVLYYAFNKIWKSLCFQKRSEKKIPLCLNDCTCEMCRGQCEASVIN